MTGLAERPWFPDPVARWGIRRLCRHRLADLEPRSTERIVARMRQSPIAVSTDEANEQHYEVSAAFFEAVLGRHLKYSCGYWDGNHADLDRSEAEMLQISAERAGIRDGMRVLDLGCGWGSLSLWLAERFPHCTLTAVSNSASQRDLIRERAAERGIRNLDVVTADMNGFRPAVAERFDRVVSIEMFEHMRNYEILLERIAGWLTDQGRLFVHVFCHRRHSYFYEVEGREDWMAKHFFTGGMMPSFDLLRRFDRHLVVDRQWTVPGAHYEKTANAWLRRLDSQRERVLETFASCYGEQHAERWLQRWRLFFMACAESFGFAGGNEWHVAHYLLRPRANR